MGASSSSHESTGSASPALTCADNMAALEAGMALDRQCLGPSRMSLYSSSTVETKNNNDDSSPKAQTMSSARRDGQQRKGGKRAPREPGLSVEARLAQALAEQGLEHNVAIKNDNNTGILKMKCDAPSSASSSASSSTCSTPLGSASGSSSGVASNMGFNSPSTGPASLVDIANRMSVVDLKDSDEAKPTRRVKPRAPSSTQSPPQRSTSDVLSGSSGSSGEIVREPVSLRSFEILRVLGKGSHGKVYLVKHRSSGVLYAMKQLKKENVLRQRQEANTRRELRVNVEMQEDEQRCPFIVPLRFAFHSRSRLYMVFDFMKGGELYTHLSIRGRLPEVLARFYAAEISVALHALHAKGLIYRDLKPENLLLDGDGHIYLADFGLCQDGVFSATAGSNTLAGTCEYLAPEILKHHEHGFAVDYWALGMVIYELLTGLPPFYSYDQNEVVHGILNKTLEFPRHVSPEARDLVERLLDRNPQTRLGSQRGFQEIEEHPFFQSIDWTTLSSRNLAPPFRPPADDVVCNFDPEFTQQRLDAEPDYVPPRRDDVFAGFYYDSEDPIGGYSAPDLQRAVTDPTRSTLVETSRSNDDAAYC
mmetsp:Transcript_9435/g.18715  ORF Transcript_9435/g.18715 Transcript_9435/m.18715 type:complete len:591 (+) Transcript_9435:332-2104(+)